MVAELLGKQAAVYLPSGTMCNEISYRVWCRPGDEIIMDKTGHGFNFETGGPAALSGAMCYPLDGDLGIRRSSARRHSRRQPSSTAFAGT